MSFSSTGLKMSTTLTIPLAIISLVVLKPLSMGTVQLNERQFHIQEGHYVEGHSVYTGRDIIVQECILRCLDIEASVMFYIEICNILVLQYKLPNVYDESVFPYCVLCSAD